MKQGEALEFDVLGLKICARQWGNPEGPPALGLHGWLDNANTFNRLAPLLPELNLIALQNEADSQIGFLKKLCNMAERVKVFNEYFGARRPKYEQVYIKRRQKQIEFQQHTQQANLNLKK